MPLAAGDFVALVLLHMRTSFVERILHQFIEVADICGLAVVVMGPRDHSDHVLIRPFHGCRQTIRRVREDSLGPLSLVLCSCYLAFSYVLATTLRCIVTPHPS